MSSTRSVSLPVLISFGLALTGFSAACSDSPAISASDDQQGSTIDPDRSKKDAGAPKDAGSTVDAGHDAGQGTSDAAAPDAGSPTHAIKTVFMILMENHNWSDIKGSSSAAYINSLLSQAAHAENYYENPSAVHPSEPNYIWLESGDNLGITTDNDPPLNYQTTTNHLVTLLANAGVSWHAWVEGIDGKSCPIHTNGLFAPKHTPMLFFSDVVGSPPSTTAPDCIANIRPYTELSTALKGNTVAQYNFITPNLCDDMHNPTGCASNQISNGDTWLSTEVPKILASKAYADNGALFITWDESEMGEHPIGMIVLSPLAKVGYSNSIQYYHSSMLRTVEEIFSIKPLLRDASVRPSLSDLFTTYP